MPTWMVVEDEPDIYDVLLAMFEIWGIEGKAFVDGADACTWIDAVDAGRVRGELPELAILDIRVPEVSGPEIAARLRRSPILGDIAIVLVTAYHMTPAKETEVMQLSEADLLLYKPLPAMPELREAMDKVIAKHNGRRRKSAAEAAETASASHTSAASGASEATSSPGSSNDSGRRSTGSRPASDETSSQPAPSAKGRSSRRQTRHPRTPRKPDPPSRKPSE